MFEKITANYLADVVNSVYKSQQTDKRKGIKTEMKPIMEKAVKFVTKEITKK